MDVELGQSVQNKLTLINEDVDFVLKEFLAIVFHFLSHSGGEHHDLLLVGSFDEEVLNVGSHLRISENFITLIDHKILAFVKFDKFSLSEVRESSWGSDDDVRNLVLVSELLLVFLNGDSTKIASDSELRVLVVPACRLGKMYLVF